MNFPCPIREPCLDDSNPIQNLSSEAPDAFIFYAYGSGSGSPSGSPDSTTPPPGGNWLDSCITPNGPIVCTSTISQEDANLCVTRLGRICTTTPGGPPSPPGSPTSPGGSPMFPSNAQSCAATCPDGTPFVFIVPAGAFVALSQILADRQAFSYACGQAQLNKVCFSDLSPTECCFGNPYSGQITSSGKSPFAFSISSGALPPGLQLSSSGNTAIISGTPTGTGLFTFTVKVVDGAGNTMAKPFSLGVIGFTNVSPPNFTQGSPYSFQFTAAGGSAPLTFALAVGSLPSGLSMDSTGLVSGTPTDSAAQTFSVSVTDAGGFSCTKQFTLAANAFGFQICNWTGIKSLLTLTGCPASALPEWNGVFDQQTVDPVVPGSVIWYFINQAINGLSVAASDTPDYPNGPWQDNDCFVQLFFDPTVPQWNLTFLCSDCTFATFWSGIGSSVDPNDPSGRYNVNDFLAGMKPDVIFVEKRSAACCPDSGNLIGATYNPGLQPARLRIKNYAAFLASLGACPLCDASGNPAWDGTLTAKYAPDNTTLFYTPAGTTGAPLFVLPALSVAGHEISNGIAVAPTPFLNVRFRASIFWEIDLICVATGQPGNQSNMWIGAKGVGSDPTGTYTRQSGAGSTPDCLIIESF